MALVDPVQPNMLLPTEHVDQRTNQVGLSSSSRALCPMCHRSMPVTRAGQIRVHGPLSNRCGGSGISLSSTAPATRESFSVVQDGPPSQTPTSPELHLRPSSVRIVKRIPRASRHLAATKLAGILDEVTDKNDIASWTRLSTFSSRCLAVPKRGGRRRSLATAVNAQFRDESELPTQPPHQSSEPRVTRDPLSNLAKRVSSKLEEGDFKGAVRITCSEDTMADLHEETLLPYMRNIHHYIRIQVSHHHLRFLHHYLH